MALNIREYRESDFNELRRIHDKFYKDEFSFSDFLDRFLCSFVVEEDGKIVTIGGVRAIAESVIVTDKEFSPRVRKMALLEMLAAQLDTINKLGYDGLHVFAQDEHWIDKLIQYGFRETRGKSLIIG